MAELTPVQGTIVDWYQQKLAASGIKEEMASQCGLQLKFHPDHGYPYIHIPYCDIGGQVIPFWRGRYRDEDVRSIKQGELGPLQSSGAVPGKYFQPKGSKTPIYWPPNGGTQHHAFVDVSLPLFVCEGEFKAIACRSALMGAGMTGLVCGIGGTSITKAMIKELSSVPCTLAAFADPVHRPVFLCMDWGARGPSRERSEQAEVELANLFQGMGARVLNLRWEVPEGAGEQKLDDFIVAGGDITKAMRFTIEAKAALNSDVERICNDIRSRYAMINSETWINLTSGHDVSNSGFDNANGHLFIQVSKRSVDSARSIFIRQPPDLRNEVAGRTFLPVPLGAEVDRYVWLEGRRWLNTAPKWPEPEVSPWDSVPEPVMFMELLRHLAKDEADNLLKFVAHAVRFPLDRPAKVIEFLGIHGSGKSTFMDTLQLIAGGYCAPIGTALTTKFNISVSNVLLGIAPDIPVHGKDVDVASAFKSISGDNYLEINGKFLQPYRVRNYIRLFMSYNKTYFVEVAPTDRRHVMFGCADQLPPDWAAEYYRKLQDPLTLASLHRKLLDVDLSGWSPHDWWPHTAARLAAEEKSMPQVKRFLMEPLMQEGQVWANEDIKLKWDHLGYPINRTMVSIGIDMPEYGCVKRSIKYKGKATRFWALSTEWEHKDNSEWIAEYERVRSAKY